MCWLISSFFLLFESLYRQEVSVHRLSLILSDLLLILNVFIGYNIVQKLFNVVAFILSRRLKNIVFPKIGFDAEMKSYWNKESFLSKVPIY